ncbi:hypothetical protein ACEQPO_04870 [Bacillus sp. SL00103]
MSEGRLDLQSEMMSEALITEKEGRMIFERLLSLLDQVEQMVISTTSL